MGMIAICDGCGRQEPADTNGRDWFKPHVWYAKSGDNGKPLMACSRDCMNTIVAKREMKKDSGFPYDNLPLAEKVRMVNAYMKDSKNDMYGYTWSGKPVKLVSFVTQPDDSVLVGFMLEHAMSGGTKWENFSDFLKQQITESVTL